jgi:hypothetical protein
VDCRQRSRAAANGGTSQWERSLRPVPLGPITSSHVTPRWLLRRCGHPRSWCSTECRADARATVRVEWGLLPRDESMPDDGSGPGLDWRIGNGLSLRPEPRRDGWALIRMCWAPSCGRSVLKVPFPWWHGQSERLPKTPSTIRLRVGVSGHCGRYSLAACGHHFPGPAWPFPDQSDVHQRGGCSCRRTVPARARRRRLGKIPICGCPDLPQRGGGTRPHRSMISGCRDG